MRRTALLNLRNFEKFFLVFKRNGILIFLFSIFLVGLFIGVFSFENSVILKKIIIDFLFKNNLLKSTFFGCLFNSFWNYMFLICITFICGTSMLGVILSPITVTLFGFFCGTYSATVYVDYGLKGIAFYAVMILPCAVLITVALLLSATESFRFSLFLVKQILSNSVPVNITLVFKEFCIKHLLISLLVLFTAFINSVLSINLADKFSLF